MSHFCVFVKGIAQTCCSQTECMHSAQYLQTTALAQASSLFFCLIYAHLMIGSSPAKVVCRHSALLTAVEPAVTSGEGTFVPSWLPCLHCLSAGCDMLGFWVATACPFHTQIGCMYTAVCVLLMLCIG